MQRQRQFVTFTIENLYFGVEVTHVQEVIRYQTMTRVPKAPAVVEGFDVSAPSVATTETVRGVRCR